jgi:hypothetical protein
VGRQALALVRFFSCSTGKGVMLSQASSNTSLQQQQQQQTAAAAATAAGKTEML